MITIERLVAATAACLAVLAVPLAQEREDRTLLSHDQMRAIINEASGERAMHHVLELVPYPRIRPTSEYTGHFRESEVMAAFAKEYGYSTVEIESFPTAQRSWAPTTGELWMTAPETVKLFDIHDVAVSVAANSANGDLSGDLVDAGSGTRAEEYAGKDVKGKVVIGSGGVGQIYTQAAQRGAIGAIGYSALYPDRQPDEIPSSSIPAGSAGFGWAVSPRAGRQLVSRLARGEHVTIRSSIKAETFPGEMEVVHATIAGDPSSTEDVIVSGHLYEGYLKQGANDDNSGCALTLEVGRAYIKLVSEGKLPRPKRTIHFLWVPEISGTNAWLAAHPDVQKRAIADLNFDMEGIRLTASRSYWILQRTPDTFPSFLNDIGQSFMEFVSDITRERVRYRANGYGPSVPVESPNGSDDAFYIKIDKHYGSSDHVTYMQHGIPAVMFITWPDNWYHSSQDTPDKQDPTQYKRAAVVATGAMTVLATSDDVMAARVVSENLARGAERMGDSQRKGLAYMADVADAAALQTAYKEATIAIRHQAEVEKGVVRSANVLFANAADGAKKVQAFEPLIDKRAAALLDETHAAYALQAAERRVAASEPAPTADERDASTLVVECVHGSSFSGCNAAPGAGGGRGGGRGGQNAGLPQHMTAEAAILLGKNKTALEIRDFLSGEFEPIPIADVMRYLRGREQAGVIRLAKKQ
jgi:Zn-dependent M28 family amino/carboxypeptidase